MEIILQGNLDPEEAAKSLSGVLKLFEERYCIRSLREIHLHVTLVDSSGDDVELIDTNTNEVYRIFEVHQKNQELSTKPQVKSSMYLAVDNTHSKPQRGKK